MIVILDGSMGGLGLVRNAITAAHTEELNGENTLEFEAVLEEKMSSFITNETVFEYKNQRFDIAAYSKNLSEDGVYTVNVEAEHVSYRLNREDYNTGEIQVYSGSPPVILDKTLENTEFSRGRVDLSGELEYIAGENASRRKVLMDFVDYLGCDVVFDNFTVNLLGRRGSANVKSVIPNRKIRKITMTTDCRTTDENGKPAISYEIEPVYFPSDNYELGDDVVVIDAGIGIKEVVRVLSIRRNPYDDSDVTLKFGKLLRGIEGEIRNIDGRIGQSAEELAPPTPSMPPGEYFLGVSIAFEHSPNYENMTVLYRKSGEADFSKYTDGTVFNLAENVVFEVYGIYGLLTTNIAVYAFVISQPELGDTMDISDSAEFSDSYSTEIFGDLTANELPERMDISETVSFADEYEAIFFTA